jgi:hypothetical protein
VFSSDLSKQSSLPSHNSILKIHFIPSLHFVIPLPHGFTNNINYIQEEVKKYIIDMRGATIGAGTAYPSGSPECIPGF